MMLSFSLAVNYDFDFSSKESRQYVREMGALLVGRVDDTRV